MQICGDKLKAILNDEMIFHPSVNGSYRRLRVDPPPARSEDFRFDLTCRRTKEKLNPTKLRIASAGMNCSNLS
jgi:hypothetical protein